MYTQTQRNEALLNIQTAHEMFLAVHRKLTRAKKTLKFSKKYHNGTGYFNALANDARTGKVKFPVAFVDDHGRKGVIVGCKFDNNAVGAVVVFERTVGGPILVDNRSIDFSREDRVPFFHSAELHHVEMRVVEALSGGKAISEEEMFDLVYYTINRWPIGTQTPGEYFGAVRKRLQEWKILKPR